jgi:molecular chaperone Hsp33
LTNASKDVIIRATAEKAPLRFVLADITQTMNEIGATHNAEAWSLCMMAEAAVASLFLSSSLKMAGTASLQAVFSGDINLIQADTTPMGLIRAMIPLEDIERVGDFEPLLSPQVLKVRKFNEHGKVVSESIIEITSSKMGKNLARFLLQSEQTRSAVGIEAAPNPENPKELLYAVGFMVEAFPDIEEHTTYIIEEVIRTLPPFKSYYHPEQGYDIKGLLEGVSGPFAVQVLKEIEPKAFCPCSKVRSLHSIKLLDKKELKELIRQQDELEVTCDFCRKTYFITAEEINQILNSPEKE